MATAAEAAAAEAAEAAEAAAAEADEDLIAAFEQVGFISPPMTPDTMQGIEANRWQCPDLDDDGWNSLSGTKEERMRALKHFSIDLSAVKIEDMKQWYQGASKKLS